MWAIRGLAAPALPNDDPGANFSQALRANARYSSQLLDSPERAVLAAVLDDALGQLGADSRQPLQRLSVGAVDVKRAGTGGGGVRAGVDCGGAWDVHALAVFEERGSRRIVVRHSVRTSERVRPVAIPSSTNHSTSSSGTRVFTSTRGPSGEVALARASACSAPAFLTGQARSTSR